MQETACVIGISYWSSDVCSSDLVDPSQRGPETNMNQWGVKIYRATKKARRGTLGGPFLAFVERGKDQSFLPAFSASPRMSPSDAPESDEPYCATACFS